MNSSAPFWQHDRCEVFLYVCRLMLAETFRDLLIEPTEVTWRNAPNALLQASFTGENCSSDDDWRVTLPWLHLLSWSSHSSHMLVPFPGAICSIFQHYQCRSRDITSDCSIYYCVHICQFWNCCGKWQPNKFSCFYHHPWY